LVPCVQAAPLDFDFRPFFLHRRREALYRNIDARCEEMVQRGLLQVTLMTP
jgi:tRNA A37 N6-isopentenylltransferase MiaA